MSPARRSGLTLLLLFLASISYGAWSVWSTYRRIPEAYAAWDVGTLLVCYMVRNDDRWPQGWDDLTETVNPEDDCMHLHLWEGDSNAYRKELRRLVRVDWSYQPVPGVMAHPVTDSRGKGFRTVWAGAEPNEMVYDWVTYRRRD